MEAKKIKLIFSTNEMPEIQPGDKIVVNESDFIPSHATGLNHIITYEEILGLIEKKPREEYKKLTT